MTDYRSQVLEVQFNLFVNLSSHCSSIESLPDQGIWWISNFNLLVIGFQRIHKKLPRQPLTTLFCTRKKSGVFIILLWDLQHFLFWKCVNLFEIIIHIITWPNWAGIRSIRNVIQGRNVGGVGREPHGSKKV